MSSSGYTQEKFKEFLYTELSSENNGKFLSGELLDKAANKILSEKNLSESFKDYKNLSYQKDDNLTFNSVIVIKFFENVPERKFIKGYVLKIRRELLILKADQEKEYLDRLYELDIIPRQYFIECYNDIMISMEEFINFGHLNHIESNKLENLLIVNEHLAKLNSIDLRKNDNQKIFNFIRNLINQNYHGQKLEEVCLDFTKSELRFHYIVINYILNHENQNLFKVLKGYEKTNENDFPENLNDEEIKRVNDYLIENLEIIQYIKNFFKNFKEHIIEYLKVLFNFENSLLNEYNCFCIIDSHKNNIFIVGENVKFIDFEEFNYFFIGYDIIYYISENIYNFAENEYPYFILQDFDEIYNLEKLDKILKFYIDKFNYYREKSPYSKNDDFKMKFDYLSINDITRLILNCIFKQIIDGVDLTRYDNYKKESTDFILYTFKLIKFFEKFFIILNNDNYIKIIHKI